MTTFLTFAVYSLKIAGDITTQSEYFPLVSVYFIIAIVYTLVALMWFICANYYVTKNRLPRWMVFVAKYVKMGLFCVFKPVMKKSDPKFDESRDIDDQTGPQIYPTNENNLRKRQIIILERLNNPKCNKCEMCKGCEEMKETENSKKKAKELLDSNVLALNFLVLFIVFIAMLSSNLYIWITVSR